MFVHCVHAFSIEHILCPSCTTWSHVMHSVHCMHASSIVHILHPASTTRLHVTYSATFHIVWFRQDNPTIHPDGVPGIVEQP